MTHYKLLKVESSATVEEIRRAYRRAALRLHPDRNPEDKDADRKFKEISAAYTVLGLRRPRPPAVPRPTAAPRPGSQVPFFRRGPIKVQWAFRKQNPHLTPDGAAMPGSVPTVVNGVPMPEFRTFRVHPMRPESNTTADPTFGDTNDSH